jgi:ABC-type dipeptide/oligopeptide/nickel transport system ATPase component
MLEVCNLKTVFTLGKSDVIAVNDVSFHVGKNEFVGVVGESGSGKSVSMLSVMNLLPHNGRIISGEVLWEGTNLLSLPERERRQFTVSRMGLIFQNPMAALNPVFTIGNQMVETICLHQNVGYDQAKKIAIDLLDRVRIDSAERRFNHYPHQFSLGMCQRIMIAITLAMKPKLLIADEPTASLDVTIQAQILDLLTELQKEYEMSILMISHDMAVIAEFCDRLYVMNKGCVVELGTPDDIFNRPKDPYTRTLISSIPMMRYLNKTDF